MNAFEPKHFNSFSEVSSRVRNAGMLRKKKSLNSDSTGQHSPAKPAHNRYSSYCQGQHALYTQLRSSTVRLEQYSNADIGQQQTPIAKHSSASKPKAAI